MNDIAMILQIQFLILNDITTCTNLKVSLYYKICLILNCSQRLDKLILKCLCANK